MDRCVGVVVIGRNEGERLRRCFRSLAGSGALVVYVDSGSTDGSLALARRMGSCVVELDTSVPFTAARARNAGFERLLAERPDVAFVQFVDGDCEVSAGWIERAVCELRAEPSCAVVCGRLRERFRDRTIYNRLCDIEWDTPVGLTAACGGIAMVRADAFRAVGGFNGSLIAGEEPELCARLRRQGWTILRVSAEMAIHDAAMTKFAQWWRRAVRAGHAFAEGFALHGRPPERMWRRKNVSILAWAIVLPVTMVALAWPTSGMSLLLAALYPAAVVRYGRAAIRRGLAARDAWLYAVFCMLSNFPHAAGQLTYVRGRVRGRQSELIEYKGRA